jgi:hypothetical protein
MQQILDPEIQSLAGIAATLAPDYAPATDDPWLGSPFQWIRVLPSGTRGTIGVALVAGWCATKGFDVVHSRSSQADRIVHGHRFEIKLSTLWKNGRYAFQQLRDQDYDYAFCLGVSPFEAHAWLIPKTVLKQYVIGHMGQHTGASGSDTAWLRFKADKPYDWMAPYGGRLADVARLLCENGRGRF